MQKRVEIAGLLGAGKTTLLNKIALHKKNDVHCIYENLSPLSDVWNLVRETNQNYYLLQSSYYLESINKLLKVKGNKIIVSDFSLRVHHYVYSFHLLQQNMINQVEWDALCKMLDLYTTTLPFVTGIILIDATPTELLDNLHTRNRNLDSNTSLDYLNNLLKCFQTNQSKILDRVPTLTFNTAELRAFNYTTEQKLKTFIDNIQKDNG